MKTTELMIGDWVNIYTFPNDNPEQKDLFPAKITTIMTALPSETPSEDIECVFEPMDKKVGFGCASRPADTILPIPLTPEILEKNGFKKRVEHYCGNEDVSYEWGNILDGTITVRFNDYTRIFSGTQMLFCISIGYVHELQNVIRYCGIEKDIIL